MAKEIKFNIKLKIDGKEQLVSATSTVENLRGVVNAAKSDIQKANAVFVNFNQQVMKFQNINGAVQQLASTLSSVTEESRTFGAAMNVANTMAGKSGDDFAKLKGQVAELSKTLPIAREELANGLYQVISNGVPEDNWIAYLQKSAKASIGGVADLGETVKVTSTIIKNYGLQWDAAESVQDKIQLTAKNGVTSFEQLAQALPRVTGNAATLGVSIDELLASFATLTGVSGNTNEVATQMAAVFTALVKPSSEASKMAQQMGIEFDAAAIKAAGGMRNFLTDLDKNVKAYASKSGMLEQEIYGKLFGSAESLRALGPLTGQLAAKFNENVEAMKGSAGTIDDAYGKVANSGAASFQMMKNAIGEFTDVIASATRGIMPFLNIGSQIGNNVVAILALNRAWITFGATQTLVKGKILATNAAALVWNATAVRVNAIVKLISASFRGATVSATTLKLAIQGLYMAAGAGVIVALTEVISRLTSSTDDAADSVKSLKEEELAAQSARQQEAKQISDITTELNLNISKLKNFKGSKIEEKKLVQEMNQTYGDTMGHYSTVSQWYATLIGNSRAYCAQMTNEIRIRALANEAANIQQQIYDETHDEQGRTKKFSKSRKRKAVAVGTTETVDGMLIPQYDLVEEEGSSDWEKANAKIDKLRKKQQSVKKRMEDLVKENGQISYKTFKGYKGNENSSSGTNTGVHVEEPKTYIEKLQAQLSAAQKEMGNDMTVEAKVKADAKIADIQKQIDEATKGKVSIEAETEPSYIVQGSDADKRQSHNNAGQRIDRIRQDFEIGLIGKEDAERQIADINKQLEKLGIKPIEVHFKTYIEELQGQLHDAQREFDEATTIEAKVKADAKITEIQKQIDEATKGKVSIEAETEPSYIVKGSDADKRQSYANAQSTANRIQSDYEVGIINKEEALKAIDDINADLEELNLNPVKIEVQTEDIDKAKEKMSGACDAIKSMGSSLSGLGDAIKVPELNIAGTMAQAIATMVDGYATATAQAGKLGPWAWIAFAATGLATLTAMISSVKQAGAFATGGVIGGTSTSGDKKFARVNSGEMILNKFQQTRLFNMVNGNFLPPTFTAREMHPITMNNISNHIEPPTTIVDVHLNANARKMLDMMSNTKKVTGKSGKMYNV